LAKTSIEPIFLSISIETDVKQLSISTHFEKQDPRCFQKYTTRKQLLLKKQLQVSLVWLAFCLLAAEAPFRRAQPNIVLAY
jgi:hypothetical protein